MRKITALLFLFLSFSVLSAQPTVSFDQQSYVPRLYLRGDAGTTEIGQADFLAPMLQDNNSDFYVYGQSRYAYAKQSWAKNPWTASFGLGYRYLADNSVIFGAYVLGDYMKTMTDHNLKQIAPGIEILSRSWDFRANGYLPVGEKKWTKEGWADQFGDYSHISYSGHNQYDAWYVFNEEAGPGVDAEIGRTLFEVYKVLVKGYVNGYFFNMTDNHDVKGLGARITIQPNTYIELSLDDSYDEYNRNVFEAGFRVSLYDLFNSQSTVTDNNNLYRRLFVPIERNFGEIGFGDDARITGGPDENGNVKPKPVPPVPDWYEHITPERTNVWFFEPGNLLTANTVNGVIAGDGTYEHPYIKSQFNQATITNINNSAPGASLYVTGAGVVYTAYTAGTPYQPITLYSGQSIWGRMGSNKGFQQPAQGAFRPIFVGGFVIGSNTDIDSIILKNDRATTGFTTGISMDGATNVIFNNDEIGVGMSPDDALPRTDADKSIDANTTYDIGVSMKNGSEVALFKNSYIYGYAPNSKTIGVAGKEGIGLDIENGGAVNKIEGSAFSGVGGDGCDNSAGNGSAAGSGYGIKADSGNITIGVEGIESSRFLGNGGGGGFGGNYGDNKGGIIGGGGGGDSLHVGGDGGNGYGLYANGATISVGNIDNSHFFGNVDTGHVETIGSTSSTKGNTGGIFGGSGSYSNATGGKGGNGGGLYLSGTNNVSVGSLQHSYFYGNANLGTVTTIGSENYSNNGGIFGGSGAYSAAPGGNGYGASFSSVNGSVSINGNISDSYFYGNANLGDVTLIGSFYSNGGGIFGGAGLDIAPRLGDGKGGNGYGMQVNSDNGSVSINGNISKSYFYGNANVHQVGVIGESSAGSFSYGGLFGGSGWQGNFSGGDGYGLYVNSANDSIIDGSISDSQFYGNANVATVTTIGGANINNAGIFGGGGYNSIATISGGKGCGFYISSVNNSSVTGQISGSTFYGNANLGTVTTIGGILSNRGGIFGGGTASAKGGDGYGINLSSGSSGTVTVGAVAGNTFAANTGAQKTNSVNNGTGYDFYAGTKVLPFGSTVNIATMTGNTFKTSNFVAASTDSDSYLSLQGDNVSVNGNTNIGDIRDYLVLPASNNIFTNVGNPSWLTNAVLIVNGDFSAIAPTP